MNEYEQLAVAALMYDLEDYVDHIYKEMPGYCSI